MVQLRRVSRGSEGREQPWDLMGEGGACAGEQGLGGWGSPRNSLEQVEFGLVSSSLQGSGLNLELLGRG